VKELYLISQDWEQRIFLRRKLQWSGDWNGSGWIWDVPNDLFYTVQILKLRWFDAGHNHDFDISNSTWVYDWRIDTRACDFAAWFVCWDSNWDGVVDGWDTFTSISTLYDWYVMPLNSADWWVDLFDQNVTVRDRNLKISPDASHVLSRNSDEKQINPHVSLLLENVLYGWVWQRKIWVSSLEAFDITIQTTFDIKSFY